MKTTIRIKRAVKCGRQKLHGPESRAPRFSVNAVPVLAEAAEVLDGRGAEYGDTWANNRWLALLAVARRLGIELTLGQARKLGAAALVDVKYSRLEGGYKEDSLLDGVNYAANLVGEMRGNAERGTRNGERRAR